MWLKPSFEPIVGDDLVVGVEVDAEPLLVLRGDLAAEVVDARGDAVAVVPRVARGLAELVDDPRLGRVGRVAHAQVDHVDAGPPLAVFQLVDLAEQVRRQVLHARGDGDRVRLGLRGRGAVDQVLRGFAGSDIVVGLPAGEHRARSDAIVPRSVAPAATRNGADLTVCYKCHRLARTTVKGQAMTGCVLMLVGLVLAGDGPAEGTAYEVLKRQYDAAEAAWITSSIGRRCRTRRRSGRSSGIAIGRRGILRRGSWRSPRPTRRRPGSFEALVWLAELNRQVGTSDRQVYAIHARTLDLLAQNTWTTRP